MMFMNKYSSTESVNRAAIANLSEEISLIDNDNTRDFTISAILSAPGKYWIRQSAFTKGHHPDDEHSKWGNLIHVKRTIIIAKMFVDMRNTAQEFADCLYSALLIHDAENTYDCNYRHNGKCSLKLCPCANIISNQIQCKRTHELYPLDGINSKENVYICDEFKEALGGN